MFYFCCVCFFAQLKMLLWKMNILKFVLLVSLYSSSAQQCHDGCTATDCLSDPTDFTRTDKPKSMPGMHVLCVSVHNARLHVLAYKHGVVITLSLLQWHCTILVKIRLHILGRHSSRVFYQGQRKNCQCISFEWFWDRGKHPPPYPQKLWTAISFSWVCGCGKHSPASPTPIQTYQNR